MPETPNYKLPIYEPTDSPNLMALGDYGVAMYTIDEALKDNLDTVGELADLETSDKSSLVAAVNELNKAIKTLEASINPSDSDTALTSAQLSTAKVTSGGYVYTE